MPNKRLTLHIAVSFVPHTALSVYPSNGRDEGYPARAARGAIYLSLLASMKVRQVAVACLPYIFPRQVTRLGLIIISLAVRPKYFFLHSGGFQMLFSSISYRLNFRLPPNKLRGGTSKAAPRLRITTCVRRSQVQGKRKKKVLASI